MIKWLLNAWKLRKSIKILDFNNFDSLLNLNSEFLNILMKNIEKKDEKELIDFSDDKILLNIRKYKKCIDKLIKDDFLKDSSKIVLKEKFDEKYFRENPSNYVLSLNEDEQERIFKLMNTMRDITYKNIHESISNNVLGSNKWKI